jgi:hypothetical protein
MVCVAQHYIFAALAMGWDVSVLATMAGGETWASTAGVASFSMIGGDVPLQATL